MDTPTTAQPSSDPRILVGSCLDRLMELPDNSVASIVTDPPYEIGFMGRSWDSTGIAYNVDLWRECLRVLKPGGHLVAFGATRSYHRMTVAIEDAGFEIRDSLHWTYGSGFPKSLDVSKAIDKMKPAEDIETVRAFLYGAWKASGVRSETVDAAFGFRGNMAAPHWFYKTSQNAVPTENQWPVLLELLGVDVVPAEVRSACERVLTQKGLPGPNWAKREVLDERPAFGIGGSGIFGGHAEGATAKVVGPSQTEAGQQWAGWGTALKPSHEPIVVARKPLAGTVAATVLEYGTGALNIDACRVGMSDAAGGRFPANTLYTHSASCNGVCVDDCPVAELDAQSGTSKSSSGASRFFTVTTWDPIADVASFRYVAKPSKRERNAGLDDGNRHPTVKPVALMRWLVRLVTPAGGTTLDPFLGSGTTAVAATLEGFDWIGCELMDGTMSDVNPEAINYLPIISGRVAWAEAEAAKTQQVSEDPTLFD